MWVITSPVTTFIPERLLPTAFGQRPSLPKTHGPLKSKGDPGQDRQLAADTYLSEVNKVIVSQLFFSFTGLRSHLYVLGALKVQLFREGITFSLTRPAKANKHEQYE